MKRKNYLPEIIIIVLLVAIIGLSAYLLLGSKKEIIPLNEGDINSRTIMIYMVGSNLETEYEIATSDLKLIKPSDVDLDNVNVILYTGGTRTWHNYISNKENAIYKLEETGFEKIKTYSKLNMGDATTLSSFLNYGYNNYHTDLYDLIIYDHGGAIDGAVYDDFTDDNLSLADFKEALSNSKFNSNNKLDAVLFRTCLNGTLEVANIFAPYANYLIASEEITNGAKGTSVLQFINDLEIQDTPIDLGKKYIAEYTSMIKRIDPTGISVDPMYAIIDLNQVDALTKEFNTFIKTVDLDRYYNQIVRLRTNMFQFGYSYYGESEYDMVDLYSLINGLKAYSTYDTTKLFDLYNKTVVYNQTSIDDSYGLSIYFPYRGNKTSKFLRVYKKLDFNEDYLQFIKDYQAKVGSGKHSSFASLTDAKFSDKEFSLQLSEEQYNEYAESIYLIFKKESNNNFSLIFSSDNVTLDDTGLLSTNISNNLIKVTDSKGNSNHLIMVERYKSSSTPVLNTTASLLSYNGEELLKATAANVYFKINKNVPEISQFINIADGVILNIEDYDKIGFVNSRFNILDENGNYKSDWDTISTDVFMVDTNEDYSFSLATLDDGEYYCVFKIVDVYGNAFFSKLSNLN